MSMCFGTGGTTSQTQAGRTKMFDTIVATIEIDFVVDSSRFAESSAWMDTNGFRGMKETHRVKRSKYEVYHPAVTYRRDTNRQDYGRLSVEFSLHKMAGLPPHENMTQQHADSAIEYVNMYVSDLVERRMDIRTWKCTRIDYAWNWEGVEPDVASYIKRLQSIDVSRMSTTKYGSTGVTWLTKSRRRAVKMYDKGSDTLRFEVSNYAPAVRYMCEHWFECEQTVDELVRVGRALYIMLYVWDKLLRVSGSTWAGSESIINEMARYGRGASTAYHIYTLYHTYGYECIKLKLCSHTAYYKWVKTLRNDGILDKTSHSLRPICLPIEDTIKTLSAQNLVDSEAGRANTPLKIWRKIFQVSR